MRNIQILEVHDTVSIMQDLMMHVSMILKIMHISLMHISMMWGYPECYRGDGEEGLLQGDSRSMMHVSSDRLDACMMHDAHIF